jgi:hypothetical protein
MEPGRMRFTVQAIATSGLMLARKQACLTYSCSAAAQVRPVQTTGLLAGCRHVDVVLATSSASDFLEKNAFNHVA